MCFLLGWATREILTRSGGQKKGISSFITDIHFYQSMDSRHENEAASGPGIALRSLDSPSIFKAPASDVHV